MRSRIVTAWRTPVPLAVRIVAIALALVSGLVLGPRLFSGAPWIVSYLVSFLIGALVVVAVLLTWQGIERRR